jgi:uncharacterized protein YdeI (YjbR/CyaY-like superfamily)
MKNYKTANELLVGFYKVGTGKQSITWPESVDEALCFGWIDGVRRSMGEEAYNIRFTPRKPTSIWSAININKVEELKKKGLMQAEGLAAYALRKDHKSKIYSYEKEASVLRNDLEKKFRANKKAWEFFQAQSPYYKKQMVHRIMDAKQEATKLSRFEKLIEYSLNGKRMP